MSTKKYTHEELLVKELEQGKITLSQLFTAGISLTCPHCGESLHLQAKPISNSDIINAIS